MANGLLICRSCRRPSSNSWSIWRLQRYWALRCRQRCRPAPTRWSN